MWDQLFWYACMAIGFSPLYFLAELLRYKMFD